VRLATTVLRTFAPRRDPAQTARRGGQISSTGNRPSTPWHTGRLGEHQDV